MNKSTLQELSAIVGQDNLITDTEGLVPFSSDASKLVFSPDAVVFPGTEDEVSRILQLADRERFAVIPRGAGTGTTGGALPVGGGLVLAMDRFDRILEIDCDNLVAVVEPGVITAVFQEEAEKVDLFYPPDPASTHISTIGGNVAANAGGLRAVKYGVTRDYVLGLRVVLPTGEIIKTGVVTAKGVVGYDLTRLIVGSEGTLAVITAIILRLIPRPPFKRRMTAFFPGVAVAMRTVSDIIKSKVVPASLEFMDRTSIECVRDEMGVAIPEEAAALLLIEVDGSDLQIRAECKKVEEICRRAGAIAVRTASEIDEVEGLWEARREVSQALGKLRPNKISEDVVVPRSRMADMVSFLEESGRRYGLPIPCFGHAGDGNIHVNIMLDKNDPNEVKKAEKVVRELFGRVLEMNGTISGEHGVGITKAPYLRMELSGPAIDLMVRLKKAFDPNNILNPGKIFTYK